MLIKLRSSITVKICLGIWMPAIAASQTCPSSDSITSQDYRKLGNLFHLDVLQAPRQVKMKVRFQVSHRKIPLRDILNPDVPAVCLPNFRSVKSCDFSKYLQRQDLRTVQGLRVLWRVPVIIYLPM